jgi:hypothetical protein
MFLAPLPVGVADPDARLRMIVEDDETSEGSRRRGRGGSDDDACEHRPAGILWARHAATSHINLYVTKRSRPAGAALPRRARLLDAGPRSRLSSPVSG